jgi:hypothetical protein
MIVSPSISVIEVVVDVEFSLQTTKRSRQDQRKSQNAFAY